MIDRPTITTRLSADEATKKVFREGTQRRVQRAIIVRLFAEYMNAIEDLGAFLYAVKSRDEHGIFYNYARSQTKDVRGFFDSITSTSDVIDFLSLPSTKDLSKAFFLDEFNQISDNITHIFLEARRASNLYTASHILEGDLESDGALTIILDYKPDSPDPQGEVRTLERAWFKTKHRFLVLEGFPDFNRTIDGSKDHLSYAKFHADGETAKILLDLISESVGVQMDLAALLVLLGDRDLV